MKLGVILRHRFLGYAMAAVMVISAGAGALLVGTRSGQAVSASPAVPAPGMGSAATSPEALLYRTLSEVSNKRIDSAISEIDKAITAYPNFRLAHLIKGDLLLARARPLTTVGNAPGAPRELLERCSGRVPHRGERPRAGEQQVAPDEMRQAEIGIGGDDLVDLGDGGVHALVADFAHRPVEQRLGAGRGAVAPGAGSGDRLGVRHDLAGAAAQDQRSDDRRRNHDGDRGIAEQCLALQLPTLSCWMSHLSPVLTITSVLVLEVLRLSER